MITMELVKPISYWATTNGLVSKSKTEYESRTKDFYEFNTKSH